MVVLTLFAVPDEHVLTVPLGQVSFVHVPFLHNPLEHVVPLDLFVHAFVDVL